MHIDDCLYYNHDKTDKKARKTITIPQLHVYSFIYHTQCIDKPEK